VIRAAQAFTVALDTVIMTGDRSFDEAGDPGAQLVFNAGFDAVARHWRFAYLQAQELRATVSYDMAQRTLVGEDRAHTGGVWRELRGAGVNIEAIWDLLIRQVEPSERVLRRQLDGLPIWAKVVRPGWRPEPWPHPGLAHLYTLTRVSGKGHSRGRRVHL